MTSRGSEACAQCGGLTYVVFRQGDFARARVCACSEVCPTCGGKGHVLTSVEETFSKKVGPRSYEVLAPCACSLRKKRVRRFSEVNLPGVLAHASFDNYRPQNEDQERARLTAREFAFTYKRGQPQPGFILGGPVGTGKTHLLASTLAHLVINAGVEARYIEISLLYATIRKGFNEGRSGGEIIQPLAEVEVLAIDELGKGRGSQFELDTMDELISRRYNAGRTTLFATNYALAPEKEGPVRAGYQSTDALRSQAREPELFLRERVGERIYSRLSEMCRFLELSKSTPDYRRLRQELDGRTVAAGKRPLR